MLYNNRALRRLRAGSFHSCSLFLFDFKVCMNHFYKSNFTYKIIGLNGNGTNFRSSTLSTEYELLTTHWQICLMHNWNGFCRQLAALQLVLLAMPRVSLVSEVNRSLSPLNRSHGHGRCRSF
jgi:hypothetical protein